MIMVKRKRHSQKANPQGKSHGKYEEEKIIIKPGNVVTIRYDVRHRPGIKIHRGR